MAVAATSRADMAHSYSHKGAPPGLSPGLSVDMSPDMSPGMSTIMSQEEQLAIAALGKLGETSGGELQQSGDGAAASSDAPRAEDAAWNGGAARAAEDAAAVEASRRVTSPYVLRVGASSVPGAGSSRNQDAFDMWSTADGDMTVFAVFDGHGKELGHLASEAARRAFREFLCSRRRIQELREDPQAVFNQAYLRANDAIREAFVDACRANGDDICVEADGVPVRLLKSDRRDCVRGGTTATLAVVLDGTYLLVANVGNSGALLCGTDSAKIVHNLGFWPERERCADTLTLAGLPARDCSADGTLLLSRYHSPRDPLEYERMQRFMSIETDSGQRVPAMRFLFPQLDGGLARDIFDVSSGAPVVDMSRASWRKNVRDDVAAIVATPEDSEHADMLAFTRSLGDFNLQRFGLSAWPDVSWVHLGRQRARGGSGGAAGAAFCLVLATDGMWDSWHYEDVSRWALDRARVAQAQSGLHVGHSAELVEESKKKGVELFGAAHADDVTCVMAHLLPRQVPRAKAGGDVRAGKVARTAASS